MHIGRLTPLLQLSIDALNSTTPDLAHLMGDLSLYIYRTITMHIGRLTPHLKLSLTGKSSIG